MGAPSFIVPPEVIAGISYMLTMAESANSFGWYPSQEAESSIKAVREWLQDVKNEPKLSEEEI